FLDILTGDQQFPHVRTIRLASDRVLPDDVERFKRFFAPHCTLINLLSSTETGSICAHVMDKSSKFDGTTVPVGYPPDGTDVLLLDESGNFIEGPGPGVIAVRSPSLSCGYWRFPALTRAAFRTEGHPPRPRLFQTADLGRRRPDGALEHLGRCDFQVKIRGHLVDTTEVEAALLAHEKVRAAAVHAPDNFSGNRSLVGY